MLKKQFVTAYVSKTVKGESQSQVFNITIRTLLSIPCSFITWHSFLSLNTVIKRLEVRALA